MEMPADVAVQARPVGSQCRAELRSGLSPGPWVSGELPALGLKQPAPGSVVSHSAPHSGERPEPLVARPKDAAEGQRSDEPQERQEPEWGRE